MADPTALDVLEALDKLDVTSDGPGVLLVDAQALMRSERDVRHWWVPPRRGAERRLLLGAPGLLGGAPVSADSPLRAAALEAAQAALLDHEWEPGRPGTAHIKHRYHGCCAVCASDLARMVPVALDAADKVLREIADPPVCPYAVSDGTTGWCAAADDAERRCLHLRQSLTDARGRVAGLIAERDRALAEIERLRAQLAIDEEATQS